MISVRKLDDLQQFGIRPLTGEACRVGRRILCDLTDDGRMIVADMLGLDNHRHTFPDPWNGRGATGSFMLPYGLWDELAIWCLIHKGCTRILVVQEQTRDGARWDFAVLGQEGEADKDFQEHIDHYRHYQVNFRLISNNTNLPGAGTRCTHAMSGRTE